MEKYNSLLKQHRILFDKSHWAHRIIGLAFPLIGLCLFSAAVIGLSGVFNSTSTAPKFLIGFILCSTPFCLILLRIWVDREQIKAKRQIILSVDVSDRDIVDRHVSKYVGKWPGIYER